MFSKDSHYKYAFYLLSTAVVIYFGYRTVSSLKKAFAPHKVSNVDGNEYPRVASLGVRG